MRPRPIVHVGVDHNSPMNIPTVILFIDTEQIDNSEQ